MSSPVAPLVDRFGRVASDLRISLTDRCSLRCTYCMPAEGLQWLQRDVLLTDDEVVRLAGVFVSLGITTIRLTGGEPLVFPRLPEIIARLAALEPAPELSLTTNGITLDDKAQALAESGLARINISLDTLDRDRFLELTRRDRLDDVLAGIAAARATGLAPLKVNTVLIRGQNLSEAGDLLDWALRSGLRLRFIEHMPLDADHTWARSEMVRAEEVLELLAKDYTLQRRPGRGPAPAEEYDVLDGPGRAHWAEQPGRVGIIASVSAPFCRSCDRVRLTADGQLRTCLFALEETDLRTPLRAGATDDELAGLIRAAVTAKQAGHGINTPGFVQPQRSMSAIGG